jgi:hypothetical protein
MTATASLIACGCLLLLLAAGCAPAARGYTERDLEAQCLVTGGRWHPAVAREGLCEYQSPGMI